MPTLLAFEGGERSVLEYGNVPLHWAPRRTTSFYRQQQRGCDHSTRTSKKDGSSSSQPCGGLSLVANSAMAMSCAPVRCGPCWPRGAQIGGSRVGYPPTPPALIKRKNRRTHSRTNRTIHKQRVAGFVAYERLSRRRGRRWTGGWEQVSEAKSETKFSKRGRSGRETCCLIRSTMAEETIATRRRRRRPRQAGDSIPRRGRPSEEAGVRHQLRTDFATAAGAGAPRPSVGSAIAAVGLFFVSFCTSTASALLQLDRVPNRITNERSATFSYVCTPLDVADGDSCDVKVGEVCTTWKRGTCWVQR